jgi:hypothetical protein
VRRAIAVLLPALLLAGSVSAGPRPRAAAVPAPRPGEVALSLFLIGDAGKPAKGGEPVLIALREALKHAGSPSSVVFLGDNVYPAGLPGADDPEFAELARRLDDQMEAVEGLASQAVFIPGNHDWARSATDGWQRLRRQEQRVGERGGPGVTFVPKGGCPGPEVVDVGERLRLVALDTQWWLHAHERPQGAGSGCATGSQAEVVAALRGALETTGGRDVIVVAHHPLQSGGPHGGVFGLREHLFPLTEWKSFLYLPLPIIGSAYPIARSSGLATQDLTSGPYTRMRRSLIAALRGRMPLAWASGHEHTLQVIESPEWGRALVSGAGIYGHVTHARAVNGTLYAAARPGFMRLDFLRDGRRRLGVIVVHADGRGEEAFARLLE